VARIRPRAARLSAAQALGLCALATRFGAGTLDLTSRANVQIRGVAEADHAALLDGLDALGLLDIDPAAEARRNVITAPLHGPGDSIADMAEALSDALIGAENLRLPAKFGFAVDCGAAPALQDASADIRLERAADGALILRADGMALGAPVTAAQAAPAAIALARWFVSAAQTEAAPRRMAALIASGARPAGAIAPAAPSARPAPGVLAQGLMLGAPFGRIAATDLARVLLDTGAPGLRVTPWRMVLLEGAGPAGAPGFITGPGDPLLAIDACPGAPLCPSASVETRALAARLAAHMPNPYASLHVSGCAKGCARARPATLTLTGRDGAFDLIRNGRASDPPERTGLTADEILAATGWT
jgi:precorrin-3B synthase